jgi:methionine synthase I (cobalamin-dependent)
MGTTIRTYGLGEKEIRGERFADSKKDLKNNGDLYSLTQAATICDIHRRFLEAGADIIETNTFSATSIGQSEFFVDDPREHGGAKTRRFTRRSSRTNSSTTSRGRSTNNPPSNAANGATASRTRPVARVSSRARSGR